MRESGSDKTHSQESKSEKNCQAPVQGITFLALVSIILVVFILIFYRNDEVPSGFYIDEAAGVLHAICIAESGVDAWDFKSYPLFFTADTSGIHSPIFVYLNAVWGSVFGFSVGSLRSLAGIVTIFTIFGTAKLLSILIGKDAFWISLLIAATSPWGFHFSRIAWDDYLFPCLTVWGIISLLSNNTWYRRLLAPILFAASMYSYSAARLQVPLILLFGLFFFSKKYSYKDLIIFSLLLSALCLPMLRAFFFGHLSDRAFSISILGNYYWKTEKIENYFQIAGIFLNNMYQHLTLNFLVFEGDSINLRHGTQEVGTLSWVNILGIVLLPLAFFSSNKKDNKMLLFLICAVICSIAPAAITWDSLPHALRSSGAWPFFAGISAWSITLLSRRKKYYLNLALIISSCFMVFFFYKYFTVFPETSKGWFNHRIYLQAKAAAANNKQITVLPYEMSLKRYYLHEFENVSCRDSN